MLSIFCINYFIYYQTVLSVNSIITCSANAITKLCSALLILEIMYFSSFSSGQFEGNLFFHICLVIWMWIDVNRRVLMSMIMIFCQTIPLNCCERLISNKNKNVSKPTYEVFLIIHSLLLRKVISKAGLVTMF